MWAYIAQRVLTSIPVILIVGVITFSLLYVAPGDPAAIIGGDEASPQQLEEIRRQLGFDKPYHIQLGRWFLRLVQGDFGTSIFSKREIRELMAPRLQPTLSLGVQVIILSSLLGVSSGMLAAWRAGRKLDRGLMLVAVLGFATPGFWLAFILIWGLAVNLRWFPVIGYSPIGDGLLQHLHSMFLPVLVNSVLGSAFISRITRSAMLEVLREDYIRTARSKGLTEFKVFIRHAFRPAAIPVVTVIGASLASLATGFVVTERVFGIPGLGRMLVDSIARRDYPIIQALLMVVATAYILINLIVDVIYAYIDPRIRY
ncbi:MAG: ABC transporter permease [SAR202 cluster bacterium]|nr:ABC transporter permease [SAR202 cluster bacterium]